MLQESRILNDHSNALFGQIIPLKLWSWCFSLGKYKVQTMRSIFEAVHMDQNIYFDGGTVVVVNFVHDEHALLLAALEE